jgi:hypothetical protein
MKYIKQEGVELTWITDFMVGMSHMSHSQRSLFKLNLIKELRDAGIRAKVSYGLDKFYIVITFFNPEDEAHFILLYNK